MQLSLPLTLSPLSLTGEQGAHTLFTSQRERERERDKQRERYKDSEREKERDKVREGEI
jgi:hypothetical protein